MKQLVSVIIILKNDKGIVDTLYALSRQTFKGKYEIIVVDRSTIKYPKIITSRSIKWLRYNPHGKRYTIPQQRNFGVKHSNGNIVVFIDASCVPNPDWLSQIVKPIRSGTEQIVMGNTGSRGDATLNDLAYTKLQREKYVQEAPTINLAISRDVLNSVGGFDEKLEYGSDVDLSWRAIDQGYKIRYARTAYITHDWGDHKEEMKRTILYGKARTRLLIKHFRARWKRLLTSDSPVLLYPVVIIMLPLALFYPILFSLPLLLILKNIREPNPVGIVVKHIFYGWGVILELLHQVRKYVS